MSVNFNRCLCAFTLAEVMLTLGTIGVVAALTIPALFSNVNENVRRVSAAVFARKIANSVEVMQAMDVVSPYSDTTSFVEELVKHLKVIKVCGASNISACWPSESVKLYDGNTFAIDNAVNGEGSFFMNSMDPSGNTADYSSENVALVLADGTALLLNYNTRCDSDDPKVSVNCYIGLIEINGPKGPNELGQDVILLNAKNFGVGQIPSGFFSPNRPGTPGKIECTGGTC